MVAGVDHRLGVESNALLGHLVRIAIEVGEFARGMSIISNIAIALSPDIKCLEIGIVVGMDDPAASVQDDVVHPLFRHPGIPHGHLPLALLAEPYSADVVVLQVGDVLALGPFMTQGLTDEGLLTGVYEPHLLVGIDST